MVKKTRRVFLEEISAIAAAMTTAATTGSVGIVQTVGVSSRDSTSIASLLNLLKGKKELLKICKDQLPTKLSPMIERLDQFAISAANAEHPLATQLQSDPNIIEPLIEHLLEGNVGSRPHKSIDASHAADIAQRVRTAFANIDPKLTLKQRIASWKQLYSDTLTQALEAQQQHKGRERSKLAEQPETPPPQPYLSDELQQYVDAVLDTQGGTKPPPRPASAKVADEEAKWQKKMEGRDAKLPPTK